jgi:hypothetical protein
MGKFFLAVIFDHLLTGTSLRLDRRQREGPNGPLTWGHPGLNTGGETVYFAREGW